MFVVFCVLAGAGFFAFFFVNPCSEAIGLAKSKMQRDSGNMKRFHTFYGVAIFCGLKR